MYRIENENGSITLSKNMIGNIIENAADGLSGKAVLCNAKGKTGYAEKKSMSYFDADIKDHRLYIKIYILVKFGSSIKMVTNRIIDDVNDVLRTIFGYEAESVSVIVKGVFSKNVAKRNIEVKR